MSAPMRILTVRQPYAWAIIHAKKDVENRSTNIAGGYRGPIAIHAGLAWDRDGAKFINNRLGMLLAPLPAEHPMRTHGAIIGVVDLVDVHYSGVGDLPHDYAATGEFSCSPWADYHSWHLVLANPRPLSEPIPYKGALGLRTIPAELQARIEAAL